MDKSNNGRPHKLRVSEQSRFLTPIELRHRRLRLASDMVQLVLTDEDDALTLPTQRTLERMAQVLDTLMQQARASRG